MGDRHPFHPAEPVDDMGRARACYGGTARRCPSRATSFFGAISR